jgi:adenosylcobinamide-phosphate synthase (EC 6.3.1.10)
MAAGVVVAAMGLDRAVAEPPESVHPVALFGRLVGPLDQSWQQPRLVGAVAALALPAVAAALVAAVVRLAGDANPLAGAVVAAGLLFATISLRRLRTTAADVIDRSTDDLTGAREALLALAGRDADALSAGHVRSAAVESAAENLADGFVAPLTGFALVGVVAGRWLTPGAALAAATAAAAWIKAINTMDSMVGYPTKPVGWAAARLDDLVMWLPARLTAVVIAAATADPVALRAGARGAGETASPNAGWPMATLAAVLDARLEKPGHYTLNAAAELPTAATAHRGVQIIARAGWLVVLTTVVIVGV